MLRVNGVELDFFVNDWSPRGNRVGVTLLVLNSAPSALIGDKESYGQR